MSVTDVHLTFEPSAGGGGGGGGGGGKQKTKNKKKKKKKTHTHKPEVIKFSIQANFFLMSNKFIIILNLTFRGMNK